MKDKNVKTKTKKKLRIKVFLFLILILYLLFMLVFNFFTRSVGNIHIYGNTYMTDTEILDVISVTSNTKLISISEGKIKSTLEESPLIKTVSINKTIRGNLEIKIAENKLLFYDVNSNELVFEGNEVMEYSDVYLGVPTLINFTPEDLLNELIICLTYVDQNLINKISEIEYAPNIKDNVALDEERFILKMNDKNTVHINLLNFEKFAMYDEFIAEVPSDVKGTLYLDSANSGHIFEIYGEDEEIDELPQDDDGNAEEPE